MNQVILNVLVMQIMIVIVLLILANFIIRQIRMIKLEKRFENFSLSSIQDHEISIFDKGLKKMWKWIHRISNFLSKSVVLQKYGKKYERHITVEEKEYKTGLDYVTIKILIGLLFVIFYAITSMFQNKPFHGMSVLIIFMVGFFLPDLILNIEFNRKRKRIEDDLLKAIIIMNNSFKSGRNIMQAIQTVKTELEGPIADEFKKIYLDITYGLSLDVVFNRFYERVKLEDAKYIASSLTLLNKTGGNIVHVFATIEKSFFDKKKLRDELNSLTAASVFVFRVLVVLPFIFALVIYILNPTYFVPLFQTKLGLFFLLFIVLLFTIYVLVIKKVLKVKL